MRFRLPRTGWARVVLLLSLLTTVRSSATIHTVRFTVLVFLNTECPVSQQYLPRLTQLYQQFVDEGVQFRGYFPLRTDSAAVVRRFSTDYRLPYACQPDPRAAMARRYKVRVTPEVVVISSDGRVRYQGAVDNWYVDLGQHRKAPTEPYLQNALEALLNGQLVHPARTEAVGCLVE